MKPAIVVPVKRVAQCAYCLDLLGVKEHPMLPKHPKQDHCTCVLVTDYEPRGKAR